MPTIDLLPAAAAAADTDEVVLSQGGVTRKATRAQLLASAQPALTLAAGQLLGRATTPGPPQPIGLGANLSLAGGVLTASGAPFAGLPAATPANTDLVPFSHAGANSTASYAQFMAALPNVPGIGANALQARATGAATTRLLGDLFANAIAVEDFGALGDGATDDSAAFSRALAAGVPLRLGPKTYALSGQFTIAGTQAVLLGIPGQTVLRRIAQTGNGAWISAQCTALHAHGIVFDANIAIATDSWGVQVSPSCLAAEFTDCVFANARGATLGAGLVFQAADPAATQHSIRGCEASGNALHGIWVQALQNVRISSCRAHDNGQIGICIDFADPNLVQKLHLCQVTGNTAWNNQRGISIGNFNSTNTTVPVWGNANPDAIAILVADNLCYDNSIYGIAAAGLALSIANNQLADNGIGTGAGLLANVSASRVCGNMVTGASFYGIDAGGSISSDISGNYVTGATHGITPGGSANMRVAGNYIQGCSGWAILVNNVETDGNGRNFGIACTNLAITDNWIGFTTGSGGILLLDNPQNVRVARNTLTGAGPATIGQALWPHTNSLTIKDNTWNFATRAIVSTTGSAGGNQIVFPDLLDAVSVTAASNPVQGLLSTHGQAIAGTIGFIAVTSGGAGYTTASVAITGDGAGAAAIAYVSNGAVIGIALTNAGAGYSTATATLTGDGAGAAATAQIALPVLDQRALTLRCNVPVIFSRSTTSQPTQQNWTNYDFTVPAYAEIVFTGRGNIWRAGLVPLADYIAPDGAGGASLTTQNNADLVLAPQGHLRIATAAEPAGITTCIGRGSPNGAVSANPGSDYRNLNGGAGATYWIKQTGTNATGWLAIA